MKKPTLRIEEQRPGNIQRDRPYHWICDDRRWAFQNPIFRRECCQEGSKRIACELPNAESRSLRRFGEGPNTDKISLYSTSAWTIDLEKQYEKLRRLREQVRNAELRRR